MLSLQRPGAASRARPGACRLRIWAGWHQERLRAVVPEAPWSNPISAHTARPDQDGSACWLKASLRNTMRKASFFLTSAHSSSIMPLNCHFFLNCQLFQANIRLVSLLLPTATTASWPDFSSAADGTISLSCFVPAPPGISAATRSMGSTSRTVMMDWL